MIGAKSGLGQKRKWRRFQVMSALPHKADIGARDCDVRFVPLPDFGRRDNFAGIGRTDPPQSQPKGSRFSRRAHHKGDD